MSSRTTTIDPANSLNLGQVTFESSSCTSLTNRVTSFIIFSLLSNGRPGGTRTPNRQIWSLLLYQIELLTYKEAYFVSLCSLCWRQRGQYLLNLKDPIVLFFEIT